MRFTALFVLFTFLLFLPALAVPEEPQIVRSLLKQETLTVKEKRNLGSGIVEYVLENKAKAYSPKKYVVVYATEDGKYVMMGALIDGSTGENLTKIRYRELTRVDVGSLPLEDALKFTYGKGGRKLIMFSDPDCPFCRRAHTWLRGQNVELYVFMYPLPIHPEAYNKSVTILCSSDRKGEYDKALSGEKIEIKKCKEGETLLKKHMLTGQLVGVEGTPLFITEEGYRIEGANLKELSDYLSKGG